MNDSTDRLPPHDKFAEKYVLGAILRDNAVLADVIHTIEPTDFYLDAHQKIFYLFCEMMADGRSITLVMTHTCLSAKNQLEDIGGPGYIAELHDVTVLAAEAASFAKIIREKSILRRLGHVGLEIQRDAHSPDGPPAEEKLDKANRLVFEIADRSHDGQDADIPEVVREVFARIDARALQGGQVGVLTGFYDLDEKLAGLQNGELILIAARPGKGKTAFSLAITRNAMLRGESVLFISLEQSRVELGERLLCADAQVDSHRVRTCRMGADGAEKLARSGQGFERCKLTINDKPHQGMLRIIASARRKKMRHGLGLVVIDYLQLIEPDNRKAPRHEQVADISRRLKLMARELQVPVLALAQLNRGSEDRQNKKPRLSDLRESGSQEQDADVVLLLHSDEDNDDRLNVIIAKQRNGPIGEVTVTFQKEFMRFDNYGGKAPK